MALANVYPLKKRKLDNWIESFLDYTARLPSPPIFRRWAAISTLAGVMERKVWVRTLGSDLYPNMYVLIIAPAGGGKTVLTSLVNSLWRDIDGLKVASSSVTRASLIDELVESETKQVLPDKAMSILTYNSLLIASNEMGVLLPSYENDFMNTLTDLWDCHPYSERRRTSNLQIQLERPQLHLLAATTPSYLKHLMPEGAWDQGFISRVIMVYSGEVVLPDLFAEEAPYDNLRQDLVNDLQCVYDLFGKMEFTQEAAAAITDWYKKRGPPQPDHPRLVNYCTRRTVHLLKLCIVASAARGSDMQIKLEDFQLALDWLLEAETFMPDIFKSMSTGGDARAIEETWHFVYITFLKEKKAIAEHRIIHFLQERVPVHNVARVLDVMERAKILRVTHEPKIGKCYLPKPRTPGN